MQTISICFTSYGIKLTCSRLWRNIPKLTIKVRPPHLIFFSFLFTGFCINEDANDWNKQKQQASRAKHGAAPIKQVLFQIHASFPQWSSRTNGSKKSIKADNYTNMWKLMNWFQGNYFHTSLNYWHIWKWSCLRGNLQFFIVFLMTGWFCGNCWGGWAGVPGPMCSAGHLSASIDTRSFSPRANSSAYKIALLVKQKYDL